MDFWEVVRMRRSIRQFTPEPVDDADLRAILEAGQLAPSPKNIQPWHFVVIRDRQTIDNLRDMVGAVLDARIREAENKARKKSLKNDRFGTLNVFGAPVVIVVLARPFPNTDPENQPIFNQGLQGVAAAIENMHLASVSLGYGGCWAVLPLEFARREIEGLLSIHPPWFAVALLSVGVPAKWPSPTRRTPLEEIVTFI